ncbi:MAG: hypothetical protein PWQ39_378 [Thermacetogenium sp.]|nr:hypothetical protein [Thermacetogenium sp.]
MERGEIRYGVFEDIRDNLSAFALKYFAAAYRIGDELDPNIRLLSSERSWITAVKKANLLNLKVLEVNRIEI